ncbi:hypothetical protein MJT46_004491 [Ovis ammon polii x Ovis aries]|nr:hypothetical protein MJT46_004491 [Ovis ammon polii x Ovis aries]
MSAFETRTDYPGETPEYPKIHVSTREESSCSGPDTTQGLRPRHRRERNPERPPRNSHGDWPFLRPPERVPEGPVVLGPGIDGRGIPRGPRGTRIGLAFPEATRTGPRGPHLEDPLPPRVHVGQPCGKASSESLVGKTRGKTIDPLLHAADCVTLLLPLWRKAQVHVRIRDED